MSDTKPEASPGLTGDAGPVTGAERFVSLDMLRGVAVLGILVMNIYAFAMPMAAYSDPFKMGGTELHNLGTWFFSHFLFDQKFMAIFSMMFGAGAVIMADRAERRGARPARNYYRRQFWLLVIGALHAYFLWVGDILFGYAALGMIAYLFRRRSPATLFIVGALLIVLTSYTSHGYSYMLEDMRSQAEEYARLQDAGTELTDKQLALLREWETTRRAMLSTPQDLQEEIAKYQGGYREIVTYRAPIAFFAQMGSLTFFGPRILGLMLFGMALVKLGVLTGQRSVEFYRGLMLAGYGLGLPLTVYSGLDLYAHEFDPIYALRYGGFANALGSVVVAFGHIGMVMLIARTGYVQRLMARFAAVGRMALTNYLMHSVILTTVFYGYGLGLYGQIPRFWQMGFVIAVLALQLVLSPWWLARYRFGPVEWLWRSITYWKLQPMRQA